MRSKGDGSVLQSETCKTGLVSGRYSRVISVLTRFRLALMSESAARGGTHRGGPAPGRETCRAVCFEWMIVSCSGRLLNGPQ